MKREMRTLTLIFLAGIIGWSALELRYRLMHWPKIDSPEAIVEFADRQFEGNQIREIPPVEWPFPVSSLSPRWVYLNEGYLDIILNTGGALSGNTGFWVLENTSEKPSGGKRDNIYGTNHPRIWKYHLAH